MKAHVVVIGTTGTQRYIFASNKRREHVGASYLVTRIEEAWLDEALTAVGASRDSRIENGPVEVVTANAGGITALVGEPEVGRTLVTAITGRALREAPGLDVCGVVGEAVEWGTAKDLGEEMRRTRTRLAAVRMARSGPQERFPGLPIVARCGSSGIPAAGVHTPARGEAVEPRSAPSLAKLDNFESALRRLATEMGLARPGDTGSIEQACRGLRQVVDHLGERAEWVAVVHADGNGMGQVFQSFDSIMEDKGRHSAREYVDALRLLSEGLDHCAAEAFRGALRELQGKVPEIDGQVPVLPLVLGGDDLTVLCGGETALRFTESYLRRFADCCQNHPDVGGLLGRGLGACAGVAIVKRHYPFHSAVRLADELTSEAKIVKTALGPEQCALSFHVLYESAFSELDRLRAGTTLPDGTRLTAQPYVIGEPGESADWARGRLWTDLQRRVAALTRTDAEERSLPRSQVHDLRSGLFLGRDVADARFALLAERLGGVPAVRDLAGEDGSLFWLDGDVPVTGLLDAMDAEGFLHVEIEGASA